jgi:DNA-binding MarR family transcriptional regulator
MRIESGKAIAGFPILRIRDAFKKLRRLTPWPAEELGRRLKALPEHIGRLLAELEAHGYVERDRDNPDSRESWRLTDLGMRFAGASAARPISRGTAERLVREFLARVDEVNRNEDYAYRVRKVVVFGSYLGKRPRLGDVDLAVTLEPRYPDDPERQRAVEEARTGRAFLGGREFHDTLDQAHWPRHEVLMHLKGGSGAIKIHSGDVAVLKLTRSEVLFELEKDHIGR